MLQLDQFDDVMFVYQAIRLANGVHAEADKTAKRCVEKNIHGRGMRLEIMAREAVGVSPERLAKEALDGLV